MVDLPEELRNRPTRPANQQPSASLTLDAYLRLKADLDELTTNGREHISERIKVAREHGDIKENADYDAAKNEQGLNEARVRQLEAMLRHVVIVEGADADVVGPGTIIELVIEGDDEPQEYLIGSIEERHHTHDVLSTSSALGQALLGKRAGDTETYETPRGKTLSVEVIDIRPVD